VGLKSGIPQAGDPTTFLIFLRKPFAAPSRVAAQAQDFTAILSAAASGRPVLAEGVTQLLIRELEPEDLEGIIPEYIRGSLLERVRELVATEDLRGLLDKLGMPTLRGIAKEIGLPPGGSPMETILRHFGYTVVPPRSADGVEQVLQHIGTAIGIVGTASSRPEMRGAFLDAVTVFERLLKRAIYGWARIAAGEGWKDVLRTSVDKPNKLDRDRLSFGDLVGIFRELPNRISQSAQAALIEQKLGTRQGYLPGDREMLKRLGDLVTQRNLVEHDRGGYWSTSSLAKLADDCTAMLSDTSELVKVMAAEHVIPRYATPREEIRDMYGRLRYRLLLDDGREEEIGASQGIELGQPLLYFGSRANPRPYDPMFVPLAANEPAANGQ
jgi:hypothetical protein